MTLAYRIELEPDDNNSFLVTCPALPEVTTWGEGHTDAIKHAADAIEEAIAARIAARQDIPESDLGGVSRPLIVMPLQTSLKVALYMACRREQVTPAELQRRLGWHREQVDRLFRLDHASRLDQIEAAFGAIGQRIDFKVSA